MLKTYTVDFQENVEENHSDDSSEEEESVDLTVYPEVNTPQSTFRPKPRAQELSRVRYLRPNPDGTSEIHQVGARSRFNPNPDGTSEIHQSGAQPRNVSDTMARQSAAEASSSRANSSEPDEKKARVEPADNSPSQNENVTSTQRAPEGVHDPTRKVARGRGRGVMLQEARAKSQTRCDHVCFHFCGPLLTTRTT